MRTVSIMQPTFLPWTGYFKMILRSDLFVFLDDVQFDRRSWQQRNKILKNDGKEFLLTIPVKSKGKFFQKINEVEVDNSTNWKDKHLKLLEMNYSKHKFFKQVFDSISNTYKENTNSLSEFNIKLTKKICKILNIDKKFKLSSDFNFSSEKKGEAKLIEIIKELKVERYLSPAGSKNYIGEGKIFKDNGINLEFINYIPKKYLQQNSKSFISHLSVIDLAFNLGQRSKDYL
jgi:hypothetical protein